MITVGTMTTLWKVISKLDIKPIVNVLKTADIFDDPKSGKEALSQLSKEKMGILAFDIIGEITPQLGKIADDLKDLASAYYGITPEEAKEKDAFAFLYELINDEGFRTFFWRLLGKSLAQEA